jgi:hypothetical protein
VFVSAIVRSSVELRLVEYRHESDAVAEGLEVELEGVLAGVLVLDLALNFGLFLDLEFETGDGELGDDGAVEEYFAVGFGDTEDFDFGESGEGDSGEWVNGLLVLFVDLESEENGAGGLVEDDVEG